jgi:uncharacterized protein (TIGR03435 family)
MAAQLLLLLTLALVADSVFAQAATPSPAFTIADVHPSPWVNFPYMNGGTLHGDRYTLRQATMVDLIANAYSVDFKTIQGGPSWLEFDRFDVVAQAPGGTPAATLKLMLRSLLIDRFGLVVHKGTAPMPAWVLTAVKPKLTVAPGGPTECAPTAPTVMAAVAFSCHDMPMDQFAHILEGLGGGYFGNGTVVDSTGLTDKYDFEFQWTPGAQPGLAGADSITLSNAMEKQLGLKLDLRTAPRPALIVDQANRTPTPNAPGVEKALPPEPPAHFEVAVIKPSRPDEHPGSMPTPDRFDSEAGSLKDLIWFAWKLNFGDDEAIGGLPQWGDSDRYDVHAKVAAEDLNEIYNGNRQVEYDLTRQMLRTLLIERFGIQSHMDEHPVTAYNLKVAGPKPDSRLKSADPAERTKCAEGPAPGERDPRITTPILNRVFHCQNVTLAEFGSQLPSFAYGYLSSPVLDKTGLEGRYDFTLSFSSSGRLEAGSEKSDSSGGAQGESVVPTDSNGAVSLNDALRHQLGLRLEKVRRPAPVLVIDHINRQPSAN